MTSCAFCYPSTRYVNSAPRSECCWSSFIHALMTAILVVTRVSN